MDKLIMDENATSHVHNTRVFHFSWLDLTFNTNKTNFNIFLLFSYGILFSINFKGIHMIYNANYNINSLGII